MSTPTEPFISDTFAAFGDETPLTPANDPNNPPWGVAAAFSVWMGSVLALIVLPILAALGYALYVYVAAGFREEALATITQGDKALLFVSILATFPAHILTLALAWAVVTNFGKRPFLPALGWSWSPNFGLWASIGLAIALLGIGYAAVRFVGDDNKTDIHLIIESSMQARIALALLAALTAPLVEEIVYRGVLFSALQRAIGTLWTVVAVLVLFTLVHVPQYKNNLTTIGVLALISVALTIVRARTGRLLPCFVIHFVFNGVQSVLIVLEPYLPQPSTTDNEVTTSLTILSTTLARAFGINV